VSCNMGKTDRVLRGIVGTAILAAGLYFQSWWGLFGLVPLGTSLISWCPLYVPLKIDTRGAGKE
jgi:hypothetical protein